MERQSLTREQVAAKIRNLYFLIADSGISRRSIIKLLADFGVPRNHIESGESMEEAMELLQKKRPHVVFAEHDLDGKPGTDLLKVQKRVLDSKDPRAFFLITSKDSNILAANAGDDEVDAVLVRPFTFAALEERLAEVVRDRLSVTPYLAKIEEGKALLEAGDGRRALGIFREASMLDPQPETAQYYEGAAHLRCEQPAEAIQCFNWVLSVKPGHLLSMMGLFDAYLAVGDAPHAYDIGKKVAQNHSIPIKRLPDLIRLSIVNGKFEDILSFYEIFSQVEQLPSQAGLSIAAGLAVCGLYFLRTGTRDSAIAAFKKADTFSKSNPRILKRIISALVAAGLDQELGWFRTHASDEILNSPEVRLAEIQYWDSHSDASRVMQMGMKAIAEGVHDEKLFERVIRALVELHRGRDQIAEVVEQGSRLYPARAEHFHKLLSRAH